jgi:hypothetical protein
MVMEVEWMEFNTIQVPDDCCREDTNPQLPLAFDWCFQTRGPGQYQFPSFRRTEVSIHGLPRIDQPDKHAPLQFTMVGRLAIQPPASEATCEPVISMLEGLFPNSVLSPRHFITKIPRASGLFNISFEI